MKKIKYLLMLLIAFTAFSVMLAEEKTKIKFFRPEKEGQVFKCDIKAETSRLILVSDSASDDKPSRNKTSFGISVSGSMTVKKISTFKRPSLIEFEVKEIECLEGGWTKKTEIKGKTLVINLEKKPVCDFKIKDSKEKVSPSVIRFLSLVFRPSSKANLSDVMGTDAPVGPGDTWDAPKKLLMEALKNRKLEVKDEQLTGKVTHKGKKFVGKTPCWDLNALFEVKDVKDFSMRASMSVLLPVDPEKGGAYFIARDGYEKITRQLPKDIAVAAGKVVTVITYDRMEASIIPVEKAEEKKKK